MLVADERGEGIPIERCCQERAQVREGVEAALGTQRVLPLVEREHLAVIGVDTRPDVEERRLAVDDEAVEIEDEGAGEHREIVAVPVARARDTCASGFGVPPGPTGSLPEAWSRRPSLKRTAASFDPAAQVP